MDPATAFNDKVVRVVLEKHWTDWLKPVATVVGFVLMGFIIAAPLSSMQGDGSVTETTLDEWLTQRDPVSSGEDVERVGYIELSGIIVTADVANEEMPDSAVITPEDVREQLASFHPDDGFKAVVLHVTTPGGMVTASDEIARIVAQYQKDVLPVYVYSDDLLASGGYYFAAAAKKIYAHKLATVGSIGVIYEIPNVETLAKDKLGVDMEIYKTGPYKDMNNPFRDRTPAEKAMIAADLEENLQAVVAAVQTGRGLDMAEVRRLATGQVWSGQKALELKLIDDVVYGDELAGDLREDLGLQKEIAFIRYDAPPSLLDEVLSAAGVKTSGDPAQALGRFVHPMVAGSYYLFRR
jgi:protease-4